MSVQQDADGQRSVQAEVDVAILIGLVGVGMILAAIFTSDPVDAFRRARCSGRRPRLRGSGCSIS